jgi:GNAT superfamily N-acetyltransferase
MVADFIIRRATAADREAVLRVAAAGMREFGLTPDFTGLDAELGRIGEGRADTVAEFVALVGTTICGSVVVSATSGRVGKLSGFYISDAYRGHGIGRALLQAAMEASRGIGLARLYLETWGGMHAAVRLYESTGWVRGEDLPTSSGADRSYWLELGAPNKALQRTGGSRCSPPGR